MRGNSESSAPPKEVKHRFPLDIRSGSASVRIYRIAHKRTASGWIYSAAWYAAGGHRRQRQFTQLDKAKDFARLKAEQLASGDLEAASISGSELKQFQAAAALAHPVTVLSAIEEWKRAREICGGALVQAAQLWAQKASPTFKEVTVASAVKLFIAWKRRGGVEVGPTYEFILNAFSREHGERNLHSIKARRIQSFLEKIPHASTRNTYRKRLIALWRWGRQVGYLPGDLLTEAEKTDRAREDPPSIGIISAETYAAMLRRIRAEHPHYIAPLALAGFCGLRRKEVHGQLWQDIDFERRFVRVSSAKRNTPARRLVPLCDAAIAWLALVAQPAGEVSPGSTWALDRIRDIGRTAGIDQPPNGYRHTYISCRVAVTKDVAATSLEAGNSPAIIHRHYREVVTSAEGEAWFSIWPEGVPRPKDNNEKGEGASDVG